MIDREHDLSITRQAEVLQISRGSVYYLPRPVPDADLAIMRRLDRLQSSPDSLRCCENGYRSRSHQERGRGSRVARPNVDVTGSPSQPSITLFGVSIQAFKQSLELGCQDERIELEPVGSAAQIIEIIGASDQINRSRIIWARGLAWMRRKARKS